MIHIHTLRQVHTACQAAIEPFLDEGACAFALFLPIHFRVDRQHAIVQRHVDVVGVHAGQVGNNGIRRVVFVNIQRQIVAAKGRAAFAPGFLKHAIHRALHCS